ncbi:hypothetical protein GCM10007886_37810 [Methylobacterium gregans]|uniref:hypothetical protein n=1 Tax=Methylobacterium gregans TaxID=374424 RepID=UPI00235B77C2|nr:hypothetical protein [Methylobacterium gregans]MDQ0523680.1 hypothetical protein [Methylobacterium gregans]GLS55596.1 hypothetical protein GCM10007886_37810 [Methylobacterium gregans]
MLQDAKTSNRGGGVRLVIVGASASALALASHLLRRDARAQIVLIEADAERCAALREGGYAAILGEGLSDAAAWLTTDVPPEAHPLRLLRELAANRDRLHVVQARCTAIAPTAQGVAVATDASTSWLGHAAARAPSSVPVPNLPARRLGAATHGHGLGRALRLDITDIPLGTGVAYLARWLRGTVRAAAVRGIPWAEVLAGVRLHAPEIWQHLPPRSRGTFLRHGFVRWNRLVTGATPGRRIGRPIRVDLPDGWRHATALHPRDLMPYAATANLLDLDVACAALAQRMLRSAAGLERPALARRHRPPRSCATS